MQSLWYHMSKQIENVISVFVVGAPVLCDSGNRLRTWQMVWIMRCDGKCRLPILSNALSLIWDFSPSTHRCFIDTGNPSSTTRL